jgi:hypothetical protein
MLAAVLQFTKWLISLWQLQFEDNGILLYQILQEQKLLFQVKGIGTMRIL